MTGLVWLGMRGLRRSRGRSISSPLRSTMAFQRTLLWMSTAPQDEDRKELASDVALEAADHLRPRPAGCPPLGIPSSLTVPAQSVDHDHVQRSVRVAVAGTAQPMAIRPSARDRQGCDAAKMCERGLAPQTSGIVPTGDQERGRDIHADTVDGQQFRSCLLNEPLDLTVEVIDPPR